MRLRTFYIFKLATWAPTSRRWARTCSSAPPAITRDYSTHTMVPTASSPLRRAAIPLCPAGPPLHSMCRTAVHTHRARCPDAASEPPVGRHPHRCNRSCDQKCVLAMCVQPFAVCAVRANHRASVCESPRALVYTCVSSNLDSSCGAAPHVGRVSRVRSACVQRVIEQPLRPERAATDVRLWLG